MHMRFAMKPRLVAGVAVGLTVLGVAAPAMAEGSRTSHMTNWIDADASGSWDDDNSDSTDTHVTFYDCTREFNATIRRNKRPGPDPAVGKEHIDCRSYVDAVRAGDVRSAKYHFDISGMGYAYCAGGGCVPNKTTVNKLKIYW